jgi:hypothetical protein
MRLGLRSVLLIVAVVLLVLAAIVNDNAFDLLALGIAAFAGAFLVDDLGLGNARFVTRGKNRNP